MTTNITKLHLQFARQLLHGGSMDSMQSLSRGCGGVVLTGLLLLFGFARNAYAQCGTSLSCNSSSAGYAATNSGSGPGLQGTGGTGKGVYGVSTSGYGVLGSSSSGDGVEGDSTSLNGVQGNAQASGVSGVYASSSNHNGYAMAARNTDPCVSSSGTGAGLYIDASANTSQYNCSWGLYQYGSYSYNNFQSPILKPSGSFLIDHPIDPANKYLTHSFVESSDMKNIYDGIATLDSAGQIVVQLPNWFQALNRDFRYQLTCIGASAAVYISREISNNSFAIAGGSPGLRVSWQVTGVRHDAFARAHRQIVEVDKPTGDQGKFLYPTEAGLSMDAGISPLSHVLPLTYVDPIP